ncbi:hypothetical protein SteCoe_29229 [Stentor coeruleus]|uniref:Receptor ligand binding region domain-containing protein n=1 Tax=Stentor coeruleus TaxID=5963 RepID=A0A1R2B6H4_9CILI|nr:hypothetical protein SteCoe_29229 [Stentor coeruleus]
MISISQAMKVALIYLSADKSNLQSLPTSNLILIDVPLISNNITYEILSQDIELVYDLTKSLFWSAKLQIICKDENIHYIQGYYSQSQEFVLAANPIQESQSLENLAKTLQVNKWASVYSQDHLLDYSKIIIKSQIQVPVSSDMTAEQIEKHLSDLKYYDLSTIFVFLPSLLTAQLLSFISTKDYSGYIWVLCSSSDYLPFSTHSDLEKQGILRLSPSPNGSIFTSALDIFSQCPYEKFSKCLSSFDLKGNYLNGTFYILNVYNEVYNNIGSCNEICIVNENIHWPKGVDGGKSNAKVLQISYEGSLVDPTGVPLNFLLPAYHGIEAALEYLPKISSTHILNATRLSLGGLYYNKTYVEDELESKSKDLGLAMISPAMSGLTVSLYNTLYNTSHNIPLIGYSNTVSMLSSQIEFPLYSRVCMPDTYVTVIIALMIKYFGWSKVGVIYIDNLFSRTLYNEFLTLSQVFNINILNQGQNMLPENSAEWTDKDLDPVLKYLDKSQARIIVVLCYTNEIDKILLRMNDLGYYGNDYEYIAVGWLVDELINPPNALNTTKTRIIRETLKGSLMFFPVSFIGDFGKEIQDFYYKLYKEEPVGYSSFAFDSVLAIYYAFQNLIGSKKDYSNPTVFMQALRSVKFVGTTGPVSIQEGKNDRSPMDHFIFNTKQINDTHWEIRTIGLFSPASFKVFSFYENITWPGDGVPSDTPNKDLCPFDVKKSKANIPGTIVLISVITLSILSCTIAAYKGWKNFKILSPPSLDDKKYEITFYDMLNIGRLLIDFCLYLGMIPSLPAVLEIFKRIGDALSLDLERIYSLNPQIYWKIYQMVLSYAGLIIISRILISLKITIPFIKIFMSLASDLFFLPIFSILLNIYMCQQESLYIYLYYDCFTQCWNGLHIFYIIINTGILTYFSIWIVYEKLRWNVNSFDEQHIFLSPAHTYLRVVFHAFIVGFKKLLWLYTSRGYTIILLVFFSLYVVACKKYSAYNSQIVNLWNLIVYFAVICICLFALASEVTQSQTSPFWLVVILCSWGILLVIGLLYQKQKKLVWPFVNNKVSMELLKFAFQRSPAIKTPSSIQPIDEEFTFRIQSIPPNNSFNL